MTERALLVRHGFTADGRFTAVGIDYAAARVFEVASGRVVAECAVNGHRDMGLTALAIESLPNYASPFVALGTATGRVIVHDCGRDATVANIAVGDASTAIVAVEFVGHALVAVSAAGRVTIIRAATGAVVTSRMRTVSACSAAAVGASHDGTSARLVVASSGMCGVFELPLQGGADNAKLDCLASFAGHSARPDGAALLAGGAVGVTATFADGALRVWDLRDGDGASSPSDRCRASLSCGHRIVAMHAAEDASGDGATLVATTIVGETLLWRIHPRQLAHSDATAAGPVPPRARIVSAANSGRLLAALPTAVAAAVAAQGDAKKSKLDGAGFPGLVLVRGRWATPVFEKAEPALVKRAAERLQGAGQHTTAAYKLPFADETKAAGPSDHIVRNEKKVTRAAKLASHGTVVRPELYDDAPIPLASSVEKLPVAVGGGAVKTLAEYEAEEARAAGDEAAAEEVAETKRAAQADAEVGLAGATSGVVVILHQALHAADVTMVSELVMTAARSHAEMVATVRGLQLPYLAQLLRIIGQKLASAGTSSPLHGWIFIAMRERGVEIRRTIELARQAKHRDPAADDTTAVTAGGSTDDDELVRTGRAFEAILTPVLDRYRRLASLRDSMAVMHGRATAFNAVKPAKKREGFLNTLQEPDAPHKTRALRMSALPKGGEELDAEDDVLLADDASDEGAAAAAKKRRRRQRKKEALVADDSDASDADDALRALDDQDSDEDGDDGSSAYDDGDADGEEDVEFDDEDDEFDDDLEEDEEGAEDDDDLSDLSEGDFDLGAEAAEEGEDEDSDLAPSDDIGSARHSRERDDDGDDEEGSDGSVEYEEGEAPEEDSDYAELTQARRDPRARRLTVDADDDDDAAADDDE